MKQCLYCHNTIIGKQGNALYCNDSHAQKYRKREVNEVKKKGGCKYCKDSKHEVFCCDEHRRTYTEIMRNIKIAKTKPKREPAEEQLKNFQKIDNFLNKQL